MGTAKNIDYYHALGLNPSATAEEIRRAYRILARRYHPDVNPGQASEERFKLIAQAYAILGDAEKRKQYDSDLGAGAQTRSASQASTSSASRGTGRYNRGARQRYAEAQTRAQVHAKTHGQLKPEQARQPQGESDPAPDILSEISGSLRRGVQGIARILRPGPFTATKDGHESQRGTSVQQISILEVSVTMRDAILGARKSIEVPHPGGAKKVSVSIPPGIRSGHVLRVRSRDVRKEELVFILRVAPHPTLSMQAKGLVVELPITVLEAVQGAHITVPTVDEPVVIKVPPGSQSGLELRVKGRGIVHPDGTRGDLFFRLMVKVPTCIGAAGLNDRAQALEQYYEGPVRQQTLNLLDLV